MLRDGHHQSRVRSCGRFRKDHLSFWVRVGCPCLDGVWSCCWSSIAHRVNASTRKQMKLMRSWSQCLCLVPLKSHCWLGQSSNYSIYHIIKPIINLGLSCANVWITPQRILSMQFIKCDSPFATVSCCGGSWWMDGVWRHWWSSKGTMDRHTAPEVPIIDMSIYNCRASTTVNSKRLTETDLGDEWSQKTISGRHLSVASTLPNW